MVRTEPPPGPLATMSQRDRELYRYPLNGRHYVLDNMMAFRLLSNVVAGSLGYTWIRDHDRSQNGRATWMALVVHYEGGGQREKRMLAALATIKALHYKNESVFAYKDFSRKLLEAYRNLKDTDEELSQFQKVKLLLEKIQITQPRAEEAKSHVRQNFRADVDGAIPYLGTEFADMFADAIVTNEGSPGLAHFHRNRPTNVGNMKMALSVALIEHSFSLVSMLQMSLAACPLMSLMTLGHGDKHISSQRESALASLTHHDLATSTRVEGGAEVEEEEDTITRNVRLELLVWQMNSVPQWILVIIIPLMMTLRMSTRQLIPTASRMDQEMGHLLGLGHTRENYARQRWYGLMQEELVQLTLCTRKMTLWQAIYLETRWIPWLIPLVQFPTGRFWNGRDTHAMYTHSMKNMRLRKTSQ